MLIQNKDIQENQIYGHTLRWRYILSLKIMILMLFLLLIECQKTTQIIPKYNGNYPTAQIRAIWQTCSLNFQKHSPFLQQEIVWQACDCYADVIREELTPIEVEGPKPITRINLKKVLIERCNPKLVTDPA